MKARLFFAMMLFMFATACSEYTCPTYGSSQPVRSHSVARRKSKPAKSSRKSSSASSKKAAKKAEQ